MLNLQTIAEETDLDTLTTMVIGETVYADPEGMWDAVVMGVEHNLLIVETADGEEHWTFDQCYVDARY